MKNGLKIDVEVADLLKKPYENCLIIDVEVVDFIKNPHETRL